MTTESRVTRSIQSSIITFPAMFVYVSVAQRSSNMLVDLLTQVNELR